MIFFLSLSLSLSLSFSLLSPFSISFPGVSLSVRLEAKKERKRVLDWNPRLERDLFFFLLHTVVLLSRKHINCHKYGTQFLRGQVSCVELDRNILLSWQQPSHPTSATCRNSLSIFNVSLSFSYKTKKSQCGRGGKRRLFSRSFVDTMSSPCSAATGGATVTPSVAAYPPSPHLKKVLRSYQSAASSSLSGPNGILAARPEQHSEASSGLVYYAFPNLPLPVVAAKCSAVANTTEPCKIRVKSEMLADDEPPLKPVESSLPTWPAARGSEYDEFKVLKFKRPAYYYATKDKDAVDLSSGRDAAAAAQTATKPLPSSPPPLQSATTTQASPLPSFPILSAADRGWSHAERNETQLEGQPIACFSVGGEPRLCLPQILNSVLRQFYVMQIHAVCDELQINCSRCTAEQLDSLKASPAILPRTAASCGLITKTDAQRLCSALLRRGAGTALEPRRSTGQQPSSGPPSSCEPNKASAVVYDGLVKTEQETLSTDDDVVDGPAGSTVGSSARWFRVYHQCFGKCEGLCKPELYTSPDAACIECADCSLTFSPADFISHAHRSVENRTCHWGFDSAHWRAYLLLARRQAQPSSNDVLLRQLDEFKNRFSSAATTVAVKRKLHQVLLPIKSYTDTWTGFLFDS